MRTEGGGLNSNMLTRKGIKRSPRRIGKYKPHSSRPKLKKRPKRQISVLKQQLWDLCRAITRKRYRNSDRTWTCYTTGIVLDLPKKVHTGHFIASSLCSTELRYDLKNLRPQSFRANIHLSGDTLRFRENLIRDHGEEYVKELWDRNERTKGKVYPRAWFENKIKEYTLILENA